MKSRRDNNIKNLFTTTDWLKKIVLKVNYDSIHYDYTQLHPAAVFSGICDLIVVFHAVKTYVYGKKTFNLDDCHIKRVSLLSFMLLTVFVG